MNLTFVPLAPDPDDKKLPEVLRDAKPDPGIFGSLNPLVEQFLPPTLWLISAIAAFGAIYILFQLAGSWNKGSQEDFRSAGKKFLPVAFVLIAITVAGPVLAALMAPSTA